MAPTPLSLFRSLTAAGLGLTTAGTLMAAEAADPGAAAIPTVRYQLSAPQPVLESGLGLQRVDADGLGAGWLGWIGRAVADAELPRVGGVRFQAGTVSALPSLGLRDPEASRAATVRLDAGGWFAGAGLGAVPAHPAWEPLREGGEIYMLHGGYMWRDRQSLSLQVTRDSRPGLEQKSVNLVYGSPMARDQWLTVGLSSTSAMVSGIAVQRVGLSVGYDWPRYFVQLAYDPKTTFVSQNALRISAGTRF